MRPSDFCPYSRPFAGDFDDCEAFQPVRFIPLSSDYHPLSPATTCRHLISRRQPTEPGRWYGACALGDAAARRAWVQAVSSERLAAISALRQQMAGLNAPFIDELWRLKAQQLAAREHDADESAVDRQMQEVGDRFIQQTARFLKEHQEAVARIDVTAEALVFLLRASVQHLIQRESGEVRWEVPEETLAKFEPPVRMFFRPPSPGRTPATVE